MKRVAVVLTAGGESRAYFWFIPLPFFLTWPSFKMIAKKIGIKRRRLNCLKEETIARLRETIELIKGKSFDLIILSGGQTPHKPSSTEMMRNWLLDNTPNLPELCLEDKSLQTSEKSENSLRIICERWPDETIELWVITSWYHIPRALLEFQRVINDCLFLNKPARIKLCYQAAFPPKTWHCLAYEYLHNIIFELRNIYLILKYEDAIRKNHGIKERKLRDISP